MDKKVLWAALIVSVLFALSVASFFAYEAVATYQSHATFEGYCQWRSLHVVNQSSGFGYCADNSGNIYRIVQFRGRWYLDGDLPGSGLF